MTEQLVVAKPLLRVVHRCGTEVTGEDADALAKNTHEHVCPPQTLPLSKEAPS